MITLVSKRMNKRANLNWLIFLLLILGCGNPLIVETYENGNVQFEYYKNEKGEKDGHYISYYENGKKRSEGEYRDSIQVNNWKYWFENGNPLSEGRLNDSGFEEGEWIFYFEAGGIQQREYWKAGMKDGNFTEFYQNGSVRRKGLMSMGQMSGVDSNFFESGILESVSTWRNGKVFGTQKEYTSGGKLLLSEYRDEESPLGMICIHDTATGDTLYKHYVIFGRLSDTAVVYKNNHPFKDTIIHIEGSDVISN